MGLFPICCLGLKSRSNNRRRRMGIWSSQRPLLISGFQSWRNHTSVCRRCASAEQLLTSANGRASVPASPPAVCASPPPLSGQISSIRLRLSALSSLPEQLPLVTGSGPLFQPDFPLVTYLRAVVHLRLESGASALQRCSEVPSSAPPAPGASSSLSDQRQPKSAKYFGAQTNAGGL